MTPLRRTRAIRRCFTVSYCATVALTARIALTALTAVIAPAILCTAQELHAQGVTVTSGDPLGRAIVAEEKGDRSVAIEAYREVLRIALSPDSTDGDRIALALLGLERLWAEIGTPDSVLPIVKEVLRSRRTDPVARAIQLRQLTAVDRNSEAMEAFLDWRRAAPGDAAPFREYARLLLSQNRTAAADSVLRDATRYIGGGAVAGELAQLHVALGRWQAAAVAYRQALDAQPWLETAAMFALSRAPTAARDSIRDVLHAEPVVLPPRRLLSALELAWGEPRRAWVALAAVRADDSTAASWRAFAERAEFASSWSVARDAWLAVFSRVGDLSAQERAAAAALAAADPETALEIVRYPTRNSDAATRERTLLPLEVEALGELGRAGEAEKLVEQKGSILDEHERLNLARPLVRAWLRSGDLERARKAAANADLTDDDEIAGWLALYEGDLTAARKRLVRAETKNPALNDALGLLARTRAAQSRPLGAAFMLLAKNDSTKAAKAFASVADSVPDASPAVLAVAARIYTAQNTPSSRSDASALWHRIAVDYTKSPEAPEALLAWARILRSEGKTAEALKQIEALLTGYPDSALLPQARREYDQLRGQVPPS